MNMPDGMFIFKPMNNADMKKLRAGDTVRKIDARYEGMNYEKRTIDKSEGIIHGIDIEHGCVLLRRSSIDYEFQFHYGDEYIIDRMNIRQSIKFYFSTRSL